MAVSKVNKQFVFILVGVLVLLVTGGGAAAYFLVLNNGARLASKGDAALQEGNVQAAERYYSKAVNKEQGNPEYLRKWIGAMEKFAPETENAFKSKYQSDYLGAHFALAKALRTDVEAHKKAIEFMHLEMREIDRLESVGNDGIADSVANALDYLGNDPKGDVLRRYRGMALTRNYFYAANMRDEEIARAKDDLEAALKIDPADGEVISGLVMWWERRADELAGKQDVDGAKVARDTARRTLDEFVAAHPNEVWTHLLRMNYLAGEGGQAIVKLPKLEDREAAAKLLGDTLSKSLSDLVGAIEQGGVANVDLYAIARIQSTEGLYVGRGLKMAEGLLRKFLESHPEDGRAMLNLAHLLSGRGEHIPAIDLLQRLIDLPQQPIGTRGFSQFGQRVFARFFQGQFALRQHEVEKEAAVKQEWLAKALGYRAKLAEVADAGSAQLMFLDGQLAFAKQDYGQAYKKLHEYVTQTASADTQALWILSDAAVRMNEDGTAEVMLSRILQREPGHLGARVKLGDVKMRLRKDAEALENYERAGMIDKENAGIKKQIDLLKMRLGQNVAGADPVNKALADLEHLEQEGKIEEAFKGLEKLYTESKGDVRVLIPYAARLAQRGEKAKALAFVEEKAKGDPDNMPLKYMLVGLKFTDPIDQRIEIIKMSTQPDIEKLVATSSVYREGRRNAEALSALQKAAAIDPNHAGVIELQFMDAMEAKDFSTADRLAEEAKKRDLDRLDGVTFRARSLSAQDKLGDAVRELEGMRNRATFSVEASKLLGELLFRQRRFVDAVAVYRDALGRRPGDRGCLNNLVALLVQLDRGNEALEEMRARREFHRGDTQITNGWLELESRFGSRELALVERQKQYDLAPNDRSVQIALARLFVEMKRWPQARTLIDTIKKSSEGLDSAEIEAQWFADQAKMADARKVFDDFIASLPPDKVTPEMHLAKGHFMQRIEQPDRAIEAYQEAAVKQDPKLMHADKALADLYSRLGRLVEAADTYKKIVSAGGDTPDHVFAKRHVDALLRARRGDEAVKALEALGTAVIDQDAQLMLQLAEAVRVGGPTLPEDDKKSAAILDQAVGKFPNESTVYYQRAISNMRFRELLSEAMKDLDRAIELRPSYWQALRARSLMHGQLGDSAKSIADLRQAVLSNPAIDELRVPLVRGLLSQNRDAEAIEIADQVIAKRPGDLAVLVNTADLFRESSRDERAEFYYSKAYELSAQLFVVVRYLDLLQSRRPPNLARADEVLVKLGDEVVSSEPALLMAKAKQFIYRRRLQDALTNMIAALRLVKVGNADQVVSWFGDVKRTVVEPDAINAVLDAVDKEKLVPGWTRFFRAGVMMERKPTEKQGLDIMEELAKDSPDPVLMRQAMLVLIPKYYQLKDWDNVIRVSRSGVEKFPDDAYLLNSLAYLMVRAGQSAKEAVPIAEKAVQKALEANRANADIEDTLGWVYARAGEYDKAEAPLLRALSMAGNTAVRATVLLHIAEMLMGQGKMESAKEMIDSAEQFMGGQTVKIPEQNEILAETKKLYEEKTKK